MRDYLRLLAQAQDRPASFQGGLEPDEVVELLTTP